jgi:gamma-glutamyltranspeptidase / glutathione hydrolase
MFDWHNPYRSARAPIFARDVVATSQPLAAQAGLDTLRRGGNAVDAAIATAAAIALVEPCSNGLGSDTFAIVWDGTQLHGLNASGTAPAAWELGYFRRRYGEDLAANRPLRGWDTVTVPGAVASWAALHGRFGKMAFGDVLAPAIDYAERGFAVSPITQEKWRLAGPLLDGQPGFAEHFLPHGRVPEVGEHFVLPGAAETLRAIAQTGGETFYRGEIAARIAAFARDCGASLTAADLAGYAPAWVTPLSQSFAGHELHEIPPNGQGIAAQICLGILQHTPLADLVAAPGGIDRADAQHLMIEAMKLAFADVYAQVADPSAMRVTPEQMLDPAYLRERARRIDPTRAQVFGAGDLPRGGTVYLATADRRGMMVSLIQSNYMGFGSGVVVPGTGVSLQNRGHGFSFDAGHPNVVGPGKRPFHTIIPAFLTHAGQPVMSFGVMGGNMQPQGHVQTLVRMLLAGQQPQAACDAPRWKWNHGTTIDLEEHAAPSLRADLAARGHEFVALADSYMDFGSGQFIWRLGDPARDGYVAASDSRRDGQACGF